MARADGVAVGGGGGDEWEGAEEGELAGDGGCGSGKER